MEEFVNRSPRSLIEKIRDFFLNFVDEIRAIAERYANRAGSERQEIKALLGMSDELTDIARFFDAALETASMETEAEVGETVFARKKSKDADDVSKWTPDSQFMWEHMSARERDIFRRTVDAISRGARSEVAANGDYIVACGHSLVYTDANPEDPKVFKIITFKTENGTMLDYGMQLVYDLEAEGTNEQELGIVLQSVLGEKNVVIRANELRTAIRGKDGSGKGNFSFATGEGNRGEVSSAREEGALTEAQTRRIESDQPVDGEVEAKWSLARNEEFMDNARNINAKTGNVDQATMDQAQLNNFAQMS